jgi:hypothetical protein
VLEEVVLLHVLVLLDKLISLREFDSFKEVWKIFIDFDILAAHCKAPSGKFVFKDLLDANKEDSRE